MNFKIINTHISLIRSGDIIEHNGKIMTVCNKDIKYGFYGTTIFGDPYRLGNILVKKIVVIQAI